MLRVSGEVLVIEELDLKCFFKGDTIGALEKFKYLCSIVSTGLCGKILGGSKYNSVPLYLRVGASC